MAPIIVSLLSLPLVALLHGFVLSTMWRWFLVPLGLPPIGIVTALGISLIVGMVTHQARKPLEGDYAEVANVVVVPLIVLLAGWIVRMFA